jgi:hypothetical protein
MVIFDVTFTHSTPEVEQKLRRVLKDGKFSSGLAVGSEGFEIVEHQGLFIEIAELFETPSINKSVSFILSSSLLYMITLPHLY